MLQFRLAGQRIIKRADALYESAVRTNDITFYIDVHTNMNVYTPILIEHADIPGTLNNLRGGADSRTFTDRWHTGVTWQICW